MRNPCIDGLLKRWVETSKSGPVVDFGWTMRALAPYFADKLHEQLRVIHLHRHPVSVAASFKLIGSYDNFNSPDWAITPFHPRAKFPGFQSRWESMSAFEKCLYLWLEVNAFGREFRNRHPHIKFLEVRSDQLFKDDEVLTNVAEFTGFWARTDKKIERSAKENTYNKFSLERRPVGHEWMNYSRHPEIIDFAEELGYSMDYDTVARMIPKYQLPKGIMPYLRNKSGYWAVRQEVGTALRSLGLRN